MTTQLQNLHKQTRYIEDVTAQLKEDLVNDRMRATAIFNQQQQNRKELSFLGTKTEDMDSLRVEMRDQRQGAHELSESITELQHQVDEWADVLISQHVLKREASCLRADLDSLRSEVARVADSQHQAIFNLRSLHSAWLGVPPMPSTEVKTSEG